MLHEVRRDALHDLEVVAHEIVAAHAGLARLAGCDDDDVGTGRCAPVATANQARVRSDDGTCLVDIKRDTRGLLIGDVDDHDVGQFLLRNRASHGHANVAGATYHCHFAIHAFLVSLARLRSLSRSLASKYSQFLLKSLLKTSSVDAIVADDPECFSGLHHRSANVTCVSLGARPQPEIILSSNP